MPGVDSPDPSTQPDASSSLRDLSLAAFVGRLASDQPVPGGGSASAVAAGLGAALVAMVARLSLGRPAYAEHEATIRAAVERGPILADRFLDLADADAAAYARLAAAFRLPRGTAGEAEARRTAVRAAARAAAEVPLACVEACGELLRVADALAGRSNRNAASDLAVASLLGEAAAEGAARNVLTNLPFVEDEAFAAGARERLDLLLAEIHELGASVRRIVDAGERRPALAGAG
jgi:formiminotetrahydrofolate cyclodeaminase